MPTKRTPVSRTKPSGIWINGKNPETRLAWKAFEKGDRTPLLTILRRDLYKLNAPELEEVILRLAAESSLKTTRKPGRPKGTSNLTDAESAEVVKDILWLLEIKPTMSLEHAYRLLAAKYPVGERTIKQYWLNAKSK